MLFDLESHEQNEQPSQETAVVTTLLLRYDAHDGMIIQSVCCIREYHKLMLGADCRFRWVCGIPSAQDGTPYGNMVLDE